MRSPSARPWLDCVSITAGEVPVIAATPPPTGPKSGIAIPVLNDVEHALQRSGRFFDPAAMRLHVAICAVAPTEICPRQSIFPFQAVESPHIGERIEPRAIVRRGVVSLHPEQRHIAFLLEDS